MSSSPRGASSADLSQAITTLRSRIEEEFKIAERLDSKARQAFALAAGFFAVVQTVTFGSFAQSQISGNERHWLLAAAVVAGACVAAVAYALTHGEKLQDEDDVRPEMIVRWCNDADGDDYVAVHLVGELSMVARNRTDNNKKRGAHYSTVVTATRVALFSATVELLVAIVVRV
jgi:hypothetical protein